jgi:hypothetical protein
MHHLSLTAPGRAIAHQVRHQMRDRPLTSSTALTVWILVMGLLLTLLIVLGAIALTPINLLPS